MDNHFYIQANCCRCNAGLTVKFRDGEAAEKLVVCGNCECWNTVKAYMPDANQETPDNGSKPKRKRATA